MYHQTCVYLITWASCVSITVCGVPEGSGEGVCTVEGSTCPNDKCCREEKCKEEGLQLRCCNDPERDTDQLNTECSNCPKCSKETPLSY